MINIAIQSTDKLTGKTGDFAYISSQAGLVALSPVFDHYQDLLKWIEANRYRKDRRSGLHYPAYLDTVYDPLQLRAILKKHRDLEFPGADNRAYWHNLLKCHIRASLMYRHGSHCRYYNLVERKEKHCALMRDYAQFMDSNDLGYNPKRLHYGALKTDHLIKRVHSKLWYAQRENAHVTMFDYGYFRSLKEARAFIGSYCQDDFVETGSKLRTITINAICGPVTWEVPVPVYKLKR